VVCLGPGAGSPSPATGSPGRIPPPLEEEAAPLQRGVNRAKSVGRPLPDASRKGGRMDAEPAVPVRCLFLSKLPGADPRRTSPSGGASIRGAAAGSPHSGRAARTANGWPRWQPRSSANACGASPARTGRLRSMRPTPARRRHDHPTFRPRREDLDAVKLRPCPKILDPARHHEPLPMKQPLSGPDEAVHNPDPTTGSSGALHQAKAQALIWLVASDRPSSSSFARIIQALLLLARIAVHG